MNCEHWSFQNESKYSLNSKHLAPQIWASPFQQSGKEERNQQFCPLCMWWKGGIATYPCGSSSKNYDARSCLLCYRSRKIWFLLVSLPLHTHTEGRRILFWSNPVYTSHWACQAGFILKREGKKKNNSYSKGLCVTTRRGGGKGDWKMVSSSVNWKKYKESRKSIRL